jgi:S-formylglutathione hydrolase FrmB
MGGFGALRLAATRKRSFAAAAGLSSVTDLEQFRGISEEPLWLAPVRPSDGSILGAIDGGRGPLPLLHVACGVDDSLLDANRCLHAALLERGVAHEYAEHPGGHTWDYWRARLPEVYRFFGAGLAAAAPSAGRG